MRASLETTSGATIAAHVARKDTFYIYGDDDARPVRHHMPRRAESLANKREHNRRRRRLYGLED